MRFLLFVPFVLFGCTIDVEHHFPEEVIDVTIGFDYCNTCAPTCELGVPICVDEVGDECEDCRITCLLASEPISLSCYPEEQFSCINTLGEEISVPVVCVPPRN